MTQDAAGEPDLLEAVKKPFYRPPVSLRRTASCANRSAAIESERSDAGDLSSRLLGCTVTCPVLTIVAPTAALLLSTLRRLLGILLLRHLEDLLFAGINVAFRDAQPSLEAV